MEAVFLHNAKTLEQTTVVCRQKALAASVSADIPKLGQAVVRRDNFTTQFSRSFSGRYAGFRRVVDHFRMQADFVEKQMRYERVNSSIGVRTTSAQRYGRPQWRP